MALGNFTSSRRVQLVKEYAAQSEQIQREKSELIGRFYNQYISPMLSTDEANDGDVLNPEDNQQLVDSLDVTNKTLMRKLRK